MKPRILIPLLLLAAILPYLTACGNEDDGPVVAKYLDIARRLPTYYKLSSDNDLIPISTGQEGDEVLLLNSTDEVRSYIGDDFLQAYPNYLSVDFNRYSLVVKTSYKFPYVINTSESEFSIIYNPYRQCWQLSETVYSTKTLEDNYYVERIALVVDKLESGAAITYVCEKRTPQDDNASGQ